MTDQLENGRPARNYGIDLLRLVSMLLVVIQHVLGEGGVLENASGAGYGAAWLMEICVLCAVNCFAMISGYVGYSDVEKPYRYSRFLTYWAQVFLYSLGITLIVLLIDPELVDWQTMVSSVLPISARRYWYASAYAGLFFFIPWLNRLLRLSRREETSRYDSLVFVLFMFVATMAACRLYGFLWLNEGYSFLWLALLYVAGAWMKRSRIAERCRTRTLLLCIAGCILLTWVWKLCVPELLKPDLFTAYVSPTMVAVAFCVVALFSRMRIGAAGARLIRCFAPAAFGVYLIHVHVFVWIYFITDQFIWVADLPAWRIPITVLGVSLGIFIVCLLIEKIRLLLFKYLKIDTFLLLVGDRIEDRLKRILDRRKESENGTV